MTNTPALRIDGVSKDYGDGPALYPVTFDIPRGERVALIGHNGSGKTTLMRIATGLLESDSGTVSIFGHSPSSMEARKRTSFISDTPTFYDDLSVMEHLEYTARLHGAHTWEDRATHLLGQLGLADRADDLPARFSRGLRQKAAIAIGIIRPFDVLLVDEPFVGLDAEGRDALLDILASAHASGAAVIVATHELSYVDTTDRTIALRDGVVVFDGPSTSAQSRMLVASEGAPSPNE